MLLECQNKWLPTLGLCAGVALGLMYELTEALFNFKSKKSFSHFKTKFP